GYSVSAGLPSGALLPGGFEWLEGSSCTGGFTSVGALTSDTPERATAASFTALSVPDLLSRCPPPESAAAASPSGASTSEPFRFSAKGDSGSTSLSTTCLGTERKFKSAAAAAPAVRARQPTIIKAACAMAKPNRRRVRRREGGAD